MLGLNLMKQTVDSEQQLPTVASSNQLFQGGTISLPQYIFFSFFPFCYSVCVINGKENAKFTAVLS